MDLRTALDQLGQRRYAELLQAAPQGTDRPAWTIALAGAALAGSGQIRSGLDQLRQALTQPLTPLTQAEVLMIAGGVLLQEGHPELARGWYEQAAALDPGNPQVRRGLEGCRMPGYLAPEVFSPAQGKTLLRHPPREASRYIYTIDIVGTCNLRCPSCPVGNMELNGRPRGFMPYAMFEAILDKIVAESPHRNPQIWLFNWGEPLLHPDLPAIVRAVGARGLESYLSSNLNVRKGLSALIAANPTDLKISLSGASEQTYSIGHERGKFAVVESNMRLLRELLDRHGSTTHVWVGHHLYRHNRHEIGAMAELCAELGFEHRPVTAFYQPLEALVEIAEGRTPDRPILAQMIEHPVRYIERFAQVRDERFDCELRFNQTVINFDGTVALCCSVYTNANQLGAGFLNHSRPRLEALKYAHDFCNTCYRHGLQYAPVQVHDVGDQTAERQSA